MRKSSSGFKSGMIERVFVAVLLLTACESNQPAERYGFVARLGNDTVAVESVTRRGNKLVSDEVDRFPLVRRRHTEIDLADDGSIRNLVMDIHTPSEPEVERDRRVEATVTRDSVHISKRDKTGTLRRSFAIGGGIAMAHLPQMYSLYELYFAAALNSARSSDAQLGRPVQMRQFYIDREFDRFPLHHGNVRPLAGGKAEVRHDWLSGTGDAVLDSSYRLLSYSGSRTTYKVEVTRLKEPPDVKAIGSQFAALEAKIGPARQLSVRDTTRAAIGDVAFTVDYSRPLARGRVLLGGIIPYDQVWRTGANAATQFTTSAPITLAGIRVPAGTYTLWTVPRKSSVDLIVNTQTGQWGTQYSPSHDLGRAPMMIDTVNTPVEKFTISIRSADARHGALVMEWGEMQWTAPIVVQ
jgi:hypothetical protein